MLRPLPPDEPINLGAQLSKPHDKKNGFKLSWRIQKDLEI